MFWLHRRNKTQKTRGFSLIELMVTVAIVAILVAVAMPSLQKHTQRAHRMEARLKLLEVMAAQNAHRLQNKTFARQLGDIPKLTVVNQAVISPQARYTITARACEPGIEHCVRLVATPSPTLNNLTLTLDSNGWRAPEKAWR